MFLSNLSIKRPVLATVMILALVTLGAVLVPPARHRHDARRGDPGAVDHDRVPRRVAGDRRARGHQADRGGGQPDLRRQARAVGLARGPLERDRRVPARGQDQRRLAGGARQDQRDPARAAGGDEGAGDPEVRLQRDADHLARGALEHPQPARPEHARRPQDQAPAREHRGGRQGQARRVLQARGGREPRPGAPRRARHGGERGGRRPAVGERQHAARPPQPRRHRDAAAGVREARATSTSTRRW